MNSVMNTVMNPVMTPVTNSVLKSVRNRESHLLTTSGLVQGIKHMDNASKDFNGSVISLMKDLCTNVNVTIKNVSDLDLCLELVTFKEAEIIDGLELYTSTNSTIVQYPVQWKQFFSPK